MNILSTNHPIIVNGVKESPASEYLSAEGLEVISSKDPIIVDGKRISNPSWYLSADGVEVISSKDPIIVDGKKISNPSWYLSADGDEFYNAAGDEFYNARGRRRKRRGLNKAIGFLPPVALVRAVSNAAGDEFYNAAGDEFYNSIGDEFYSAEGDTYSYIDKKSTNEVKSFQTYANTRGANPKLVVDGIWGAKTEAQYARFGAEWEALRNPPQGTPAITPASTNSPSITAVSTNVPQVPAGQQPTVAQIEEQRKKGVFWDKAKGTWIRAKQSGVLDWLAGIIGVKMPRGQQGNLPPVGSPQYGSNTTAGADRKLSRNAKIAIGIGGALVVGLIIYSITRKRK